MIKLYVAPEGSDKWSGRLAVPNQEQSDGPLASLQGARRAIRQFKKENHGLKEAITVKIKEGQYFMEEPLKLQPEDSGTDEFPITYEATGESEPVFCGGKIIDGWQETDSGLWKTEIPEVKNGDWFFEQLFVNNRRAQRARIPGEFYNYMLDVEEIVEDKGEGRRPDKARQIIKVKSEDLEPLLNLDEEELQQVNLVVYHKWDNTIQHIDKIDPENNTIITSGRGMKSWNNWHENTRFHLENFKKALTDPGEWFLAQNGILYYKPLPEEDISQTRVVAPILDQFIILKGDTDSQKFVKNINFRGLTFKYSGLDVKQNGFEANQAAFSLKKATILAEGSRNIAIEECSLIHIGHYGIWFREGCQHCQVQQTYIRDMGTGGVRIGTSEIMSDHKHTSHITVDNNIIRSGGRVLPCAVGIWIGQSSDNQVTHNDIADLYYTGISAGWTWGYTESRARNNTLDYNHIHHLGQEVLSDMGGVYCLGISEGTTVSNNHIHHVRSYDYGGWGLYTDEGSTDIRMENNLVYKNKSAGFHQHYGKENKIQNNIFAFNQNYQLQLTRAEDHISFIFKNNIIYWDEGPLLDGKWEEADLEMNKNIYWKTSGTDIDFNGNSWEQWQKKGRDRDSEIADPEFADPENLNFKLKDDSLAEKIDFETFDYREAGVYGKKDWKKLAANKDFSPLPSPPS